MWPRIPLVAAVTLLLLTTAAADVSALIGLPKNRQPAGATATANSVSSLIGGPPPAGPPASSVTEPIRPSDAAPVRRMTDNSISGAIAAAAAEIKKSGPTLVSQPRPEESVDPFNTLPIYTGTTPNSWPGARGSPENGYHFYGLSYSPFGVGDNRLCPPYDDTGGWCLLPNQVAIDMEALSKLTGRLKTYSAVCTAGTDQIMASARQHGMKVMFGVWIENDAGKNMQEFDRAINLIRKYKDVVSHIMIGNEPVFVLGLAAKMVAESVRIFRTKLARAGINDIPIGVADIYNIWMGTAVSPKDEVAAASASKDRDANSIVKVVDWIGLNSHAYWGGIDPTTGKSGKHIANGCDEIESKWGKPCIITETGYPTVGDDHKTVDGVAKAGVDRLSIFLNDMESESRSRNRAVYMFEPYNGDWKRR